MRKQTFEADPVAGSAMRRMRGLSREIGFALALTAAAAASFVTTSNGIGPQISTVGLDDVVTSVKEAGQP